MKKHLSVVFFIFYCVNLNASPEFEEILLRAVQYDPVFNDRRYDLQSELLDLRSYNSQLYPQVVASFSRNKTKSDVNGPESSVTSQGDYKTTTASVSLEQLLFDASVFHQVTYAEKRMLSLVAELRYERNQLIERISSDYANFQYQLYLIDVLSKRLELTDLVYGQSLEEKEKGLVSELALTLAQSERSRSEMEWLSAKKQLLELREGLSRSVRISTLPRMDVCQVTTVVPEQKSIDYDLIYENNARIQQLRYDVEAQQYEVKSRRSDYYPTIKMNASYSEQEQDGGSFDGSQTNQSVVSLSLELPLYLGGRRNESLHASNVRLNFRRDQLITEQHSLVEVVEALYQQIDFLKINKNISETAIKASEKSYDIARKDFSLGATNQRDLLKSESEYLDALAQQQRVCGELLTTSLRLHHVLGTHQYF